MIDGNTPSFLVLNLVPLTANAVSGIVFFILPDNTVSTLTPGSSVPTSIVSGDILYCIMILGYRELRSNEHTQSCIPT